MRADVKHKMLSDVQQYPLNEDIPLMVLQHDSDQTQHDYYAMNNIYVQYMEYYIIHIL